MNTRQSHSFILASASPQRIHLLNQMGIQAEVQPVDLEENHELGSTPEDLVEILALEKLNARLHTPLPSAQTSSAESIILAADTIVAIENERLGKPEDSAAAADFLSRLQGRTHRVLTAMALYLPPSLAKSFDPRPLPNEQIELIHSSLDSGSEFASVSKSDSLSEKYRREINTSSEEDSCSPHQRLTMLDPGGIELPGEYSSEAAIMIARSCTCLTLLALNQQEIGEYLSWGEWNGAAGGYRVQGRAGSFLQAMSGSHSNVVGLPIELLYAILRRTSFEFASS